MSESYVYLEGGDKESGTLFVWEVYPEKRPYSQAIKGKNAELVVNAADAQLMSLNYIEVNEMECWVKNKSGKVIGTTPRRPDNKEVYEMVAKDVAQMLGKDSVKITIR